MGSVSGSVVLAKAKDSASLPSVPASSSATIISPQRVLSVRFPFPPSGLLVTLALLAPPFPLVAPLPFPLPANVPQARDQEKEGAEAKMTASAIAQGDLRAAVMVKDKVLEDREKVSSAAGGVPVNQTNLLVGFCSRDCLAVSCSLLHSP